MITKARRIERYLFLHRGETVTTNTISRKFNLMKSGASRRLIALGWREISSGTFSSDESGRLGPDEQKNSQLINYF